MKNLVLIGFMGSGKSVVGETLAKKLNLSFIETDKLIENKSGISINEIFEKEGEPFFRTLEKETVKDASDHQNTVISVGGGAILDEDNVKSLKRNGFFIYLKAPFTVLYDRIKESTNRPLLAVHNPEDKMQALLEARQMTYESVADLVIDVSSETPEEITEKIVKELKY